MKTWHCALLQPLRGVAYMLKVIEYTDIKDLDP